MPGRSFVGRLPALHDSQRVVMEKLEGHVDVLAVKIGERNVGRIEALEQAATHVEDTFRSLGLQPTNQWYEAQGRRVRNVYADLVGDHPDLPIVVIGAHYDSTVTTPGADDNASGVAAMLELARLLRTNRLDRTVRFVAFVNEEPPFFLKAEMGSWVFAQSLRRQGVQVAGMFSLETMGYYSDAKGSQRYPPPFNLVYPDTGNFIAFIGNMRSRALVRRSVGAFRRSVEFPSEGCAAPGFVPGVFWSDHWSFWKEGYPALMVTDTAPFRNTNYHTMGDLPGTMDFDRFARVVWGLQFVIADAATATK